jgi:flavorubredoxin
MELNDYINQAQQRYPNGYADYYKENGDETDYWFNEYKENNRSYEANGYLFNYEEMAMMDTWSNEKFWTFVANIDYNFNKQFNK